MPTISYFREADVRESAPGGTILEISKRNGIPHVNECGGKARCSTCRVSILEGIAELQPRNPVEASLALRKGWGNDVRLACQTRVMSDLAVRRIVRDKYDLQVLSSESSSSIGQERHLAILFCDIRNFTRFSDGNLPYDIFHVMNRYFREVCDPVLANNGFIDKYIGDGLLALFGLSASSSPEETCLGATRAALRIVARVAEFNQYLRGSFGFEFEIGIGLHFGKTVIGELGHPSKMQFTALGDAVNVASRLESLTKKAHARILASGDFVKILSGKLRQGRTFRATVRGKDEKIKAVEILDLAQPDAHLLVQSTFEKLVPLADEVASTFYGKLFQDHPDLRKLFIDVDLAAQGKMLMNMLAIAVRGLGNLDDLIPAIRDLGKRHQKYGVKETDFAAVGEALLATLAVYLEGEFTRDVEIAWANVYQILSSTMIAGLVSDETSMLETARG